MRQPTDEIVVTSNKYLAVLKSNVNHSSKDELLLNYGYLAEADRCYITLVLKEAEKENSQDVTVVTRCVKAMVYFVCGSMQV